MTEKKQQSRPTSIDRERDAIAKLVRPLPLHIAPSLQFVSDLRAQLLQMGDERESLRAA